MDAERQRCAAAYPDWKNDEYNCLDNKFIFGITLDNPCQENSFNTVNDFMVYYNRKSKMYFYNIDPNLNITYINLLFIKEYFKVFLLNNKFITDKESDERINASNLDFNNFDLYSAKSLKELYLKFKFFIKGLFSND